VKITFIDDRVFAYTTGRPSNLFGAERQLLLLGRALAAQGWSVVFGVDQGLAPGARTTHDRLNFVGIGGGAPLANWRRFLVSERPDWTYWRAAYHLWGPAIELAKWAGAGTIFAAAFDSDVHPHRALTLRPRWWPLYAWALTRADRIFVQHQGQLANLRRPWRSKAHIVYSIAGATSTSKPHRERSGYIAWVGMLRQPKRPDMLIDIARHAPNLRFVVCGGPSVHRSPPGYGDRMVDALKVLPNVEYLGQVPPEQAHEVMRNAAVLLSTADEEGFPNTFLQSWSTGTPVVSLKVDPDRIIERRGLGVVAGTVEKAVTALQDLLTSPECRDAIGARAVQHVSEAHSEASVTAAFHRAIGNGR
jgi:glycosyltransferase involved in cell wall biosynthesis